MNEQYEHAKRWIEKARNDLLNADNNLAASKVPYDTVCFHCQQAAEKLLKSFLVSRGRQYPITHNLFVILESVLELEPMAEYLRQALATLNPYSVEVRYPGDAWMPSPDDATEARRAAQEIHDFVKSKLQRLF